MSDTAISGSPPAFIPASNVCDFIFSNPFHASSQFIRHAPPSASKNHHVPPIPLEKPFMVDPISGAQLSWQRARLDALRVAGSLYALGLKSVPHPEPTSSKSRIPPAVLSPMILLHLPNCLAFAPLLYGVFAAGLTATMANPALTATELKWILENAKPQVIVTSRESIPTLTEALEMLEDQILRNTLVQGRRIFAVDTDHEDYGLTHSTLPQSEINIRNWKSLISPHPLKEPVKFTPQECASRIAVVLWSSGTSGKSKGVLLSHQALTASIAGLWHINPTFDAQQRWLGFVPFYHVFGLCNVLLLAPCCGATVFIMPKFNPQSMIAITQSYRITFLHMAPPVAVLLAKSPMLDGFDLSSVQGGVSGGAPLAREIIELVFKRLGFIIKLGYGLSETASVCNQVGEDWRDLESQHGSTGLPVWGVELKIISLDTTSEILQKGQEGEILVRSPSVMNSYLNNETATAESLDQDGWFHTGDIGKIDNHGFLWITDRLKEVIKVKGFQVSPSDLEGILCGSALVADAAVTSIYNAAQGTELPRAYIVPAEAALHSQCAPGQSQVTPDLRKLAEELRALMEKKTAQYKWLRGNIVFVQQIPKSPAGKILRRLLKDAKGVEVVIYEEKKRKELAKL